LAVVACAVLVSGAIPAAAATSRPARTAVNCPVDQCASATSPEIPRQSLRSISHSGSFNVICTMSRAGTCTLMATITAEEADRLGQALGPRWKTPFAVGAATHEFAKPGHARMRVRLGAGIGRALAKVTQFTVTLYDVEYSGPGYSASGSQTYTFRR
jgi:hypothetical protein